MDEKLPLVVKLKECEILGICPSFDNPGELYIVDVTMQDVNGALGYILTPLSPLQRLKREDRPVAIRKYSKFISATDLNGNLKPLRAAIGDYEIDYNKTLKLTTGSLGGKKTRRNKRKLSGRNKRKTFRRSPKFYRH